MAKGLPLIRLSTINPFLLELQHRNADQPQSPRTSIWAFI
jgi:hypothetical protein